MKNLLKLKNIKLMLQVKLWALSTNNYCPDSHDYVFVIYIILLVVEHTRYMCMYIC